MFILVCFTENTRHTQVLAHEHKVDMEAIHTLTRLNKEGDRCLPSILLLESEVQSRHICDYVGRDGYGTMLRGTRGIPLSSS